MSESVLVDGVGLFVREQRWAVEPQSSSLDPSAAISPGSDFYERVGGTCHRKRSESSSERNSLVVFFLPVVGVAVISTNDGMRHRAFQRGRAFGLW